MAIKVFNNKLHLFFVLAVSLLVSLMAFNNSYALEVGGIEIPSSAYYSQTGTLYYNCVSGFMTDSYHNYGSGGIYGTLSGTLDCSSYPNATQALITAINLNQGIADYSSDYIHMVFVSDQDWIDYCGEDNNQPCSLYTNVSFTRYTGSGTKMYIYDGLTCEVDNCEVTSDTYFSIPVVDSDIYYTFLQFPAGYNYQRYVLQNDYRANSVILAYSAGSNIDFGYYYWGDDTDIQPDISNDVPLSPIWTDPDFQGGDDIATDLQNFNFSLFNPFGLITPLFTDEGTYCMNVLHEWIHIASARRCVSSPWPSAVRQALSIAGTILFSIYLFGFGVSWLRSTSAPFAKITDDYLGSKEITLSVFLML